MDVIDVFLLTTRVDDPSDAEWHQTLSYSQTDPTEAKDANRAVVKALPAHPNGAELPEPTRLQRIRTYNSNIWLGKRKPANCRVGLHTRTPTVGNRANCEDSKGQVKKSVMRRDEHYVRRKKGNGKYSAWKDEERKA